MQYITAIQLAAALAVIVILALAWACLARNHSAYAKGYDLGYDNAKRAQQHRLDLLQCELDNLSVMATNLETARRLERDELIQDADRRIAVYASRAAACTSADVSTLRSIASNLQLAAEMYDRLHASDQARFAHTLQQQALKLADRMEEALTIDLPGTEAIHQLEHSNEMGAAA